MSLTMQRILVLITWKLVFGSSLPIYLFHIHQNKVYLFFLISQHLIPVAGHLNLYSHYCPRCCTITDACIHQPAHPMAVHNNLRKISFFFSFPWSCYEGLQASPFLCLVLDKGHNCSCASGAHRSD